MSKFAALVLGLALVVGEVDARGSTRDTTLATFNAALTYLYPDVEARTSLLIDQIIKSDVDIFCLQEVWYADIQKQIYNGVKDYYPYALSAVNLTDNTVSSEPACTTEMLGPFVDCQMNFCSEFANDTLQFAVCTVVSRIELLEIHPLPETCVNCVVTTQEISICLTDPASRHEKSYGLMILSTKELMNPLVQGQNNQSQRRGLLTASVDGVGDLLCTELTPNIAARFGDIYFGPPAVFPLLYSSYAEQQYDEVLKVIDFATSVDVPVLMGTFNHGPAAPGGITWQFPFHYGLMNARGFYSSYVLQDGRCTRCSENRSRIIDHIYITSRILDDVFTESGLRLSDHFGVKVTFSNVRKNCNPFQECWFFCESEIEELLPLPPPDCGQICVP